MEEDERPNPHDAELIDFLMRMLPAIWGIFVDGVDEDGDTIDGPQGIIDNAESWVWRYRYEVRNIPDQAIPLVGGPQHGALVTMPRGEPSPWYEIRQAGQRHHYTLTRLHCGHWEYRYREDAPPEEGL